MARRLFTPCSIVCNHGTYSSILWLGSNVKFKRSCYHFRSNPVSVLAKWTFRLAIWHDGNTSYHTWVSSHSVAVEQNQSALHLAPIACSDAQCSVYCIPINLATASYADCNCLQLFYYKIKPFSCWNLWAAAVEPRVLLATSFALAIGWLASRICKVKVARLSNTKNIFIGSYGAPGHDIVNVRRTWFRNV